MFKIDSSYIDKGKNCEYAMLHSFFSSAFCFHYGQFSLDTDHWIEKKYSFVCICVCVCVCVCDVLEADSVFIVE
jgi:hypothetical protein